MFIGCIPNTGNCVNSGMHKIYLKAKVIMWKNRFLSKGWRRFYAALLFDHTSTGHVWPGIQMQVRNTPFLQLP